MMNSSFRPKMRCRAGVHPVSAIIAISCAVVLAGCKGTQQRAAEAAALPAALPPGYTDVSVWTDELTGCQYIVVGLRSITPRIRAGGTPICKPTTDSATGA